jgi:TetR/AcrR family transcriptional regulator
VASKVGSTPRSGARAPRKSRGVTATRVTSTKNKRKEQTRAILTRRSILDAALEEFAEKGFEGASTRAIGERAGLDHTLITYHFSNKEALWRAVAEHSFETIESMWDSALPPGGEYSPVDRVKAEFRTFLQFTMEHTAFHHFMLRENQGTSPRLPWLVKRLLHRTMDRVVPQIREAQAQGQLIEGDPVLLYYMLVGMTSVLSSLSGEMRLTLPRPPTGDAAIERYWELVERVVFRKK